MKLSKRMLDWMIISYILLVFYLSTSVINASLKLNRIKVFAIRSDYLLHALMFIPWMILAHWRWSKKDNRQSLFWLSLAAGFLMTGFFEMIQYLLPYRTVSNKDFLANLSGLAIGAMLSLKRKKTGNVEESSK